MCKVTLEPVRETMARLDAMLFISDAVAIARRPSRSNAVGFRNGRPAEPLIRERPRSGIALGPIRERVRNHRRLLFPSPQTNYKFDIQRIRGAM
ncbi:hypothetical protein EVAR_69307_1 [Eumeta japonica]|uniref:Uncharacterized protein n=1 Tax=Eumeta variegata TaxID=151549 RepID=A0A4C2A205_EUMVA|nr:hypothetical protein EVAR_69307_1 [Eumeta japonica]